MPAATSRAASFPPGGRAEDRAGTRRIAPERLDPNSISLKIYGDPSAETAGLDESIREHGILVPLVVEPGPVEGRWEILSGHRRWACARAIGLAEVPCEVRPRQSEAARRRAILEYNRHRRKSFSQLMREADVLEELCADGARRRRLANLRRAEFAEPGTPEPGELADRRNSDDRGDPGEPAGKEGHSRQERALRGRTDEVIARQIGLGGKDLYRQARGVWRAAQRGDTRARSGVCQLDAGTKTIHAAYKDLRRRDRFSADFRPTPYDVWPFRHDRAFGIPHPGSIPPAIVAHTLHYFTPPGGFVVDPMAGGGTTLDVCQSMGRRCLAYDLEPTRPEIVRHDIRAGFPAEAAGCDLIFCDPPYHTMLAQSYVEGSVSSIPLKAWIDFLHDLTRHAFTTLRPGGYLALLLASQTEKDLPAGHGYLDHAFFGYSAALRAGFLPERRISCPMDGGYLPQQVRRARVEGRLLGQVRDLLVVRRPLHNRELPGLGPGVPEPFFRDIPAVYRGQAVRETDPDIPQ
jgi:ParB family chromosome partitioning protein